MIMLDPQRVAAATGPCARIVERAHAWIDGELAEGDAAELCAHVVRCPACAAVMEVEARFIGAVRAHARIEAAPAALRSRLRTLLGARR